MFKRTEDDTTFIGIDVSKQNLDVFISRSNSKMQVKNNEEGFSELLKIVAGIPNPVIFFESTGIYGKDLVAYFLQHNISVAEVNAARIYNFSKNAGKLAKTDKIDAEMIALYAKKMGKSAKVNFYF